MKEAHTPRTKIFEMRLTALLEKVGRLDEEEMPRSFIFIDGEAVERLKGGQGHWYQQSEFSRKPTDRFQFAVLVPDSCLKDKKFDPSFGEPDIMAEWIMDPGELSKFMVKKGV